jgi:NCS1 family nucleobase:cation symporter-1
MIAFSAMALIITSASAAVLTGAPIADLWNPEFLLGQLTSASPPKGLTEPLIASAAVRAVVAVVAVFGIVIATLSVNIAANVVSPANDFANLAPRHISFERGGLITGVLGILCMPWKLMADPATYLDGWLGGVSALLGPVAGILICDYFLLRRTELDVADLYRVQGRYGRWNPAALVALAAGIAPNLPGFLQSIGVIDRAPAFFAALYPYAWFNSVPIAAVVYMGLSALRRRTA